MLESEAKTKRCPLMSRPILWDGIPNFRSEACLGSGCMMWAWQPPEYDFLSGGRNPHKSRDYTLEEKLERNPDRPKDGWEKRKDGISGWQRPIPQEQRHGSCGLANLTVSIERE